jgi:chromosome segregation ATPase
LALAAIAGWRLLFVSRQSAAEFEEHLRGQVSSLHQRQIELLDERAQIEAAVGTLEKLRSDVAALRQEHEKLKQARDQAQAELARVRAEQEVVRDRSSQAQATRGEAASPTDHSAEPDHTSIITAQRALTKLGYGPLVADGIVGPSTRQAIKDFQQGHGLRVTSELDPSTLRQLTASNKTATLE